MKYILMFLSFSIFLGIFRLFAISTYSVTAFDVGLVIFYIYAAKKIIWDGQKLEFPKSFGFYCVCGIVLTVLLSGAAPVLEGNPDKLQQYIKTSLHIFYLLVFAILCAGLKIKIVDTKRSIQMLMICAVVVHLFGIYQLVARATDLPLAWLNISDITLSSSTRGIDPDGLSTDADGITRQISLNYGSFYRATSIFSEPSALAGFCNFILICLLVPVLRNEKPFFKSGKFNSFLTILTVVSLFLTFSLTGLVLFLGIIGFAFITDRSKSIVKILKIICFVAVLLFITDFIVESTTQISVAGLFTQRVGGIISTYTGGRIESTGGESFYARWNTLTKGVEIWLSYPITGIGLGCYFFFMRTPEFGFSDSGLFSVLAETGIIGVAMFIGMFAGLFRSWHTFLFTNLYKKLQPDTRIMVLFALYNLLINFISAITANPFVTSYFWLQIGISLVILRSAYQECSMPMFQVQIMQTPFKKLLSKSVQFENV
ncbi:MAG: O-antigen ligase family protein [Ignavibacteriae bacterium]|nr:O-antigen ligase family protein [Ignavibacteriota bacterium]